MPCIVCFDPTAPRYLYCPRCRHLGRMAADNQSILCIRYALINSWDRVKRRFICHYTGVELDEKSPKDPFYISFDHIVPGEKRLVCCAYLCNCMKNVLTGDEFMTVVPALADRFELGLAFNRDIIGFSKWDHKGAPYLPRRLAPWEAPSRGITDCVICHKTLFPRSMFCPRCRKFIVNRNEKDARVRALIDAFDPEINGFRCHYIGVPLELIDFRSPWYLTFDHRIPGMKGDLLASALWINDMKSFLTETEFKAVVVEMARHIRLGTPFNKAVVNEERFRLAARKLA